MGPINIRKREFWRRHIAEASQFPAGIGKYCEAHGLRVSAFFYWKKKLRKGHTRLPVAAAFAPVEVTDLRRRELPDPRWLAELICHLSGSAR